MKRPRTYIDETGTERNGQEVQDAYDREQESRREAEREEDAFMWDDDDNYPYEIENKKNT